MNKNKKTFNIKRWHFVLFILAVIIVAFLSLWRATEFHFWRDDWDDNWSILVYHDSSIHYNNGVTLRLHPGLAVERTITTRFFGLNVFNWQVFGIILRVLSSLVVALMVFGLMKSKKAGILAGLFMASSVGGLESVTWISAYTSVIFVFFFSIGVYFWVTSLDLLGTYNRSFILALIFLSISVAVTPARGIMVLPAMALWDFLSWLRVRDKKTFLKILFRNIFLVLTFAIVVTQLNSMLGMVSYNTILKAIESIFKKPELIENYFSSIGNLLISWFYPINEPVSLGSPTTINLVATLSFILITILLAVLFLWKKTRFLQTLIFFSFWTLLFYLPNWVFEKTLIVGSSHRYISIAAVAIPCLAAVVIYKLRTKFLIVLSVLFIVLNIYSANRVLEGLSGYRSYKIVQPIWDQIDREVPHNQKDMIFMYFGSDLVWGTSMIWSGSVPFAIKREIGNPDDFPIVTGDRELVSKLLCERGVYRPSFGKWSTQKERIPISHLYAWEWKDGVLTNVSEREKEGFTKKVPCRVLP
jgi:hypothetical protein